VEIHGGHNDPDMSEIEAALRDLLQTAAL